MILIDALYINDSGGKILLDYLINSLEKSSMEVFYLLDKRLEGKIPALKKTNKLAFKVASIKIRSQFYSQHQSQFSAVFCFGNLPPNFQLSVQVFTYFHQQLYISIPKGNSLIFRAKFHLKRFVFKKWLNNTNLWLVQSEEIQRTFTNKFKISTEKVKILPFYPPLEKTVISKIRNTYIYISSGPTHKNHVRLINAFCAFFDKYKVGSLTLTISEDFPELIQLIREKNDAHYPVINVGFVERKELAKIYLESEYLIYPSLAESFGLGLIEAMEAGCKIIGADLPYTYAVCEPSLSFNALDEKSIENAFAMSLETNIEPSVAKVSNKINELLALLQHYEDKK